MSGLHIAIVMGVSFAVLRFALAAVPPLALRLPGKPVAAVGALVVGGGYMLLTGAEVPMQRSFAMAALACCLRSMPLAWRCNRRRIFAFWPARKGDRLRVFASSR